MDIFIGNIPGNTTVLDLKKFFKGFDKNAVFEVKRLKGRNDVVTFGLVSIHSERLAHKAIKRLHMKKLKGKPVVVREFTHRAGGNDRRQLGWRNKLWLGEERRQTDRRSSRKDQLKDFDSYAA